MLTQPEVGSESLSTSFYDDDVDELMRKAKHIIKHAVDSGRSEARVNVTGKGAEDVREVRSALRKRGYASFISTVDNGLRILVIRRFKLAS